MSDKPVLDNWIAEFSLTDEADVLDDFALGDQAKIWGLMRIAWDTAAERAYAAGQAVNGPTCHKCGKLVEAGDILCSEHEQQMILALGAARRHRLQELHDKWIGIFHELSSEHFGNHNAEHIANTYRVCAEELEVIALLQPANSAAKSKEEQ